jgi:hypothetical protein
MRPLLAALAALAVAVTGCGHFIGDGCNSNVDCSPQGDRFCDLSQFGGYCTVEGCDLHTCPDGEPCVRFFTVLRTEECDYDPTQPGHCTTSKCCRPDERCVPDAMSPSMSGPTSGIVPGHCAPESSERRWCMHHCGNDGDCRDQNYTCVSTSPAPSGSKVPVLPGALPVTSIADPAGSTSASSFCIQRQ